MNYLLILGIAAFLGLIPANIAKNKGHSFGLWWFYGWMLFIAAIIHVNFIEDRTKTISFQGVAQQPVVRTVPPSTVPIQRVTQPVASASSTPTNGDRFKELYRLPSSYYLEGCPVIVDAAALLKDNQTGGVLAQVRLKNISEKNIISCKVAVKAYELNGTELQGVEKFSYLDLNAAPGMSFGAKIPIYMPDPVTRRFSISIIETISSDETIWSGTQCDWIPIPPQKTVTEYWSDPQLAVQFSLEAGENSAFAPVIENGLYRCMCGAVNLSSNARCCSCGRITSSALSMFDKDRLSRNMSVRLQEETAKREEERLKAEQIAKEEAERAEAARIEKERQDVEKKQKAEAKARKRKDFLKVIIPTLLIVAGLVLAYFKVVLPKQQHDFSTVSVGDVRLFGKYEQDNNTLNGPEDIEWIVLEKGDNKAFIISKYVLTSQPYNVLNTAVVWENASLRNWLNSDFYDSAFTSAEQMQILKTTISSVKKGVNTTNDIVTTEDKVFLLDAAEFRDYLTKTDSSKCLPTAYALAERTYIRDGYCWWWLRNAGKTGKSMYINPTGGIVSVGYSVSDGNIGVRPAMWVSF